jgi:alcohol dehydrogenase (cytochrome c)
MPNARVTGSRVAVGSEIRAGNVASLRPTWRYPFPGRASFSGIAASTPIVRQGAVFVQDLNSNVQALSLADGHPLWRARFARPSDGPNGVTTANGMVFGNTDQSTFALDARTGRVVWQTRLTTTRNPITIAPVVANGRLVLTSSTGMAPSGRGILFGLDAATGRIRWRFDTILSPWRYPQVARGGGAWQTPTVDANGDVYWGTANPYPWGGTPQRPNGGDYPGDVRHTDSLVVLSGRTGSLRWADQVTPHDIRDYDFQLPPILALVGGRAVVVGGGKSGRVIAWDRSTHRRLWETMVGLRRNDVGPLPARPVSVCPGLLGGVETPMALSGGRVFVPVVDLCFRQSSHGPEGLDFFRVDYSKGKGELVALDARSGRRLWTRKLPSPNFGCATVANDVVFTATYDGTIYGLSVEDGRTLWKAKARAGINACPAVAGRTLLVVAGTDHPAFQSPVLELEAFRLPD